MDFIIGVIVGRFLATIRAVDLFVGLPLAVLVVVALGWGGYEAVEWFDVARATWEPSAWYAQPWNWPGAYIADMMLTEAFPTFHSLEQNNIFQSPFLGLILVPVKLPAALFALGINTLVAVLPIVLMLPLIGCVTQSACKRWPPKTQEDKSHE